MRFQRKIKLTFLKLFINSLSKYLICKRIFVLGYLPKLKRGLEVAFGAHFLHVFNTNAPYLIGSTSYLFFTSQDIKQKVLLILFRQFMTS